MKTQIIEIKTGSTPINQIVEAVQGDSGRVLRCIISDMSIPAGSTARFYAVKPSGAEIYNDCAIDGQAVVLNMTTQMLAEVGTLNGQIEVTNSGKTVTSFSFCVNVIKNIKSNSAIESSNEFTALDNALKDAEGAAYKAVSEYAAANGLTTGATPEQVEQIEQNTLVISELKGDLNVTNDEAHEDVGGKTGMVFLRGTLYNSEFQNYSYNLHRVANKQYYSFPYDIKITLNTGFSIHLYYKSPDGTYTDEYGNKCIRATMDGGANSELTIEKNNEFRIMIRRATEQVEVLADIEEFVNALHITTLLDNFININYPYVTPEMYGAVGNGATDDSTAFINAISACLSSGKALHLQGKRYLINSQIVIPYSTGKQKPLHIIGCGAYVDGQGLGINGGTVLIMNFDTTNTGGGKITALGVGSLEIEGVTFTQTDETESPYIYTTYASLFIHNCSFIGTRDGVACNQDAIILGGDTETETHFESGINYGFQGYGTVIRENYFNHIRRAVYCRAFANGVVIENNCIWNKCGSNLAEGACIEIDDCAENAVQYDCGVVVMNNLIEVCNYIYPIKLIRAWNCSIVFNNLFDAGGGSHTAMHGVYFMEGSAQNLLITGFNSRGYGTIGEYKDKGTDNMIISPLSGIVAIGRRLWADSLTVETPDKTHRYKLSVSNSGEFLCEQVPY